MISDELKVILQFKRGTNSLKEPSSKASRCHPSSILKSSRDNDLPVLCRGGTEIKILRQFFEKALFSGEKSIKIPVHKETLSFEIANKLTEIIIFDRFKKDLPHEAYLVHFAIAWLLSIF